MEEKKLNDKQRDVTETEDGLLLPEFFRVTEKEDREKGVPEVKVSKRGDIEGDFWLPQPGKKGGRSYLCRVQLTEQHQLINIISPLHPVVDMSYAEMVYIRNIFWAPEVTVVEIYPNIEQYAQRRTTARTLSRWLPRRPSPIIKPPGIIT